MDRHQPGDTVDVDEATAEWLRSTGALGGPEAAAKPARRRVSRPEPDTPPTESTGAPSGAKRPRKAAPVDEWRAYATASGIDPAGLSKAEIIAAVR